jgi:serine/threonine protein kinase
MFSGESAPQAIGPYKIESFLEKGGMSSLYFAIHPQTKSPVAVKTLAKKFLNNPEAVAQFLHEGAILSKLDHPSIVKLYQADTWEGGYYLAMEFVQGISLREYILKQHMSLKHALELVVEIAYTLCHIHAQGIIHRDLKPENIFIDDEGKIKLLDFGIARSVDEPGTTPMEAYIIGTPVYTSPEQKESQENASYASDIYSLGLIAYEMILGRLSQGKVSVSLLPRGLQPIISRALQPNIEQRYQDSVDFIADLSMYLHSPQLAKELRAGDKLSELSEQIGLASRWLSPAKLPLVEGLESGVFLKKKGPSGGIWYELHNSEDSPLFYLFLGNMLSDGIAGMCDAAAMRALTHATMELESLDEKVMAIYDFTDRSLLKPAQALTLFACDKMSWHWTTLVHGRATIFSLKNGSETVKRLTPNGILEEDLALEGVLAVGDLLFFCNDLMLEEEGFLLPELQAALLDYRDNSVQRLIEGVMRRMKSRVKEWPEQGFALLALRRTF